MYYAGLLDLKQPQFHGFLGGHAVIRALAADQEALLPHPVKQPVLADLHAVLSQQLCQLTHQDVAFRRRHRIRKDHLRLVGGVLGQQGLPLFFGPGQGAQGAGGNFGQVLPAGAADAGQHFACPPPAELAGRRQLRRQHQAVQAALVDDGHAAVLA